MEYRKIETAPEDKKVRVVWGEESQDPEYGTALKIGDQWYIHGQANPHANGRPCAVPDGWLPKDTGQWTKAEKRLCDILALHPDINS
jgi:hypothetical protein